MRIRLYLGEQQAQVVQMHQTISLVVSQAFGEAETSDDTPKAKNFAEAQSAIKGIFG